MSDPCWRIQKLELTTSTNDDVRRAAEAGEGEGEGLVVVASRQSAGRGRLGRVWESPVGNLYCSTLLRPRNMPQSGAFYSFVAALAIRDVVRHFLPQSDVTLKWPNDVLVGGKKISGILLEAIGDSLIVGVGLNIGHYPETSLYPVTSLRAEGLVTATATAVLDRFLAALGVWHDVMQKQGFDPIRQAWLSHAQTGPMKVRLPHETLQGNFAGLDETGRLRLLLADGTERSISTGDVFLNPKA